MSIEQILFLSGAFLSFGAIVVIIIRLNRHEQTTVQATPIPAHVSLSEILAGGIVTVATDIMLITKRSANAAYLFLLLFARRIAAGARQLFHQVENRCSGLIETIHGRNRRTMTRGRRGAVSFFLKQIKIDKRR